MAEQLWAILATMEPDKGGVRVPKLFPKFVEFLNENDSERAKLQLRRLLETVWVGKAENAFPLDRIDDIFVQQMKNFGLRDWPLNGRFNAGRPWWDFTIFSLWQPKGHSDEEKFTAAKLECAIQSLMVVFHAFHEEDESPFIVTRLSKIQELIQKPLFTMRGPHPYTVFKIAVAIQEAVSRMVAYCHLQLANNPNAIDIFDDAKDLFEKLIEDLEQYNKWGHIDRFTHITVPLILENYEY